MFLGSHPLRLDEKGRLFLPARFRDELAGGVVITKGQERCLFVFTREAFAAKAAALENAPLSAKAARDYGRMLFGGAYPEVPDKQGRVTLTANLRAYAGLSRECVVVGANSRLEIWDAQAWATYESEQEQSFASLEEEVLPGVF